MLCCSVIVELHVLQRITGCNLEKFPNGTRKSLRAFDKYAFDGNGFISFDYDSMKWIEKSPKAKETKKKWDRETGHNELLKRFLTNCMDWVSTFNNTKESKFQSVHFNVFVSVFWYNNCMRLVVSGCRGCLAALSSPLIAASEMLKYSHLNVWFKFLGELFALSNT